MVHFGRKSPPRMLVATFRLGICARMSDLRILILGLAALGALGGCQDTSPIQAQITALHSQAGAVKGELAGSRRLTQAADAQSQDAVDASLAAGRVAAAAVETTAGARKAARGTTDALDRQELHSR